MKTVSLYSIGHSNRNADELIALLTSVGVTTLVDVRAHPASARHPQFSIEALRQHLEQEGIVYHWAGRPLGGFRQPRPDSPHTTLEPMGLRGFADHMQTDSFRNAIGQLIHMAEQTRCALMCAEKHPADCHRALIADHLTASGVRVLHLIEPDHTTEHPLNPLARWDGAALIYDRSRQPSLPLGV